jgi:hypothetical protein
MNLATLLALALTVPIAIGIALCRAAASVTLEDRASRAWIAGLLLLLILDTFLALVFAWSIAVFNCHGGYECPV